MGPLNGPFLIVAPDVANVAEVVIGYLKIVTAGLSAYNNNDWEKSSLLNSFAVECFEEIDEDNPDAAALLRDLEVDCSALSPELLAHPIFKMDRAILKNLPGVRILD